MDKIQKMDKTVFKIIRSSEDMDEENVYWLTKTPEERLEAIEYLRNQFIVTQKLPTRLDKSIFAIHYGK